MAHKSDDTNNVIENDGDVPNSMLDNDTDIGPILIVDDDTDVHEELAETLLSFGFIAWHARDVASTLDIVRRFLEIRILLVDINMPGRSGIDLIQELRDTFGDYHECIVITGYASKETAISGIRLGVSDFLEKPLDIGLLQEAIEKCRNSILRKAIASGSAVFAPNENFSKRIRELKGQIDYLGSYDKLTGFLNRDAFIAKAKPFTSSEESSAAMLIFDVDGFRSINNMHGYSIGDDLLIELAGRIERHVSQGEIVARIGGDRFALFSPNMGGEGECMERMRAVREAVSGNYISFGKSYEMHVSAGGAIGMADIDGLLASAEAALCEAKMQGSGEILRSI